MRFIADFHIHSKYSRATSPQMDLEHLDETAKIKGIKVLGTGDFTHPEWLQNLKEKLTEAEQGLFVLKGSQTGTRFILTSEISCIYSKNGKVRKIHIVVIAPDFGTIDKINQHLSFIGNLKSDGRPILGLDAKELAKIVLNINPDALVVPAHIMTPWFSLFGSRSGFDSLEECFEDYSRYIYAAETGLSASPDMLWRMPDCRKLTLVSNSDAHSAPHIGREANVFEGEELSYQAIAEAIKRGNRLEAQEEPPSLKLAYTIEFFPEEGKYHYDGHRNCGISCSPEETKRYNGICPVCGRPLTVGVLNRVEKLADRPEGFKPADAIPYKKLIPLQEIIAEALGIGVGTKAVEEEYKSLIAKFNSEFNILLEVPASDLGQATVPEVAEGILRVREGRVNVEPGYDGVYGKINIFGGKTPKKGAFGQKSLF